MAYTDTADRVRADHSDANAFDVRRDRRLHRRVLDRRLRRQRALCRLVATMNRRAFLALIGSATIAALAPWPAILQQRTVGIVFHPDAFAMAMRRIPITRMDVLYGFTKLPGWNP